MRNGYKAVLFDWDGTLVDTTRLIIEAHNHVRSAFGKGPVEEQQRAGVIFKSAREAFPETYGDKAQEAERLFYEYYHAHHKDFLAFFDGTRALLQMLQNAGIPAGIVSNKRHDVLGNEITDSDLTPLVTTYVGAGRAHRDKPAPDPLLMAIEKIDAALTPKDILYIGDTETDLLCAQACGADCIYIHHIEHKKDLIAKYNPIYVANSLMDIQGWLFESVEKQAC